MTTTNTRQRRTQPARAGAQTGCARSGRLHAGASRLGALGLAALASAVMLAALGGPVQAAGEAVEVPRQKWKFSGVLGHFDRNQLQRGFKVYQEVCATCHGISRVYFRNLSEKGGPEFPEDGVRSLAAAWSNRVPDITETGESAVVRKDKDGRIAGFSYVTRAPRLSDRIPGPYKNEEEARSVHNGAYPPDLSLMAKARNVEYTGPLWFHPLAMLRDMATGYQEGGADYLYALLTGYKENAPAYRRDGGKLVQVPDREVRDEKAVMRCVAIEKGEGGKPDTCTPMASGMHYNSYFPGHMIAMAQPLRDGQVAYTDGTPATLQNYSADLAAFLSWTADPSLNARKDMGWQVMLYLLITTILLYLAKRAIWRNVH